jgi:hypothetical protein
MSSLTSIQIQALVRNMDESMRRHKGLKRTNQNEYRKKVADENQRLYDEFPSIYEMHIDGKLDEKFFNMLKLRRQIEKGEISEDDASKLVGQMLFDQYVAPIVGNAPVPSQMTYEQYYQQSTQAEQLGDQQPSSDSKTDA